MFPLTSSIDRHATRQLLAQQHQEIAFLDAGIANAQLAINQLARVQHQLTRVQHDLTRSRREAEKLIQKCHAALSYPGVASLPPEILSEIFQHVLHDAQTQPLINSSTKGRDSDFGEAFPDAYDPLTPLCGVCTNWRDVVLKNALFWTRAGVRIENLAVGAEEIITQPLRRWLDRSRSLALKVGITWDGFAEQRNAPIVLLEELLSHFDRWETVVFQRQFARTVDFPELPADVIASKLRRVKFDFKEWDRTDIAWAKDVIRAGPLVSSLHWTGPVSAFGTDFPCTSLRSLTLSDRDSVSDGYSLIYLLSVLPLLEEFEGSFKCFDNSLDIVLLPPDTLHTRLRVLKIYAISSVTPLLETCILPALTELRIDHDDYWDQSSLMTFLQRSNPKLTSLTLRTSWNTSLELKECLAYPSIRDSLTTLDLNILRYDYAPISILEHLTPSPNLPSALPLPKLERLSICLSSYDETRALAKLLDARWIKLSADLSADSEIRAERHADLKGIEVDVQFLQRLQPGMEPSMPVELKEAFDILKRRGVEFEYTTPA